MNIRTFRGLWLLAAVAPTFCPGADDASRYFDIPAQELNSALNEFARQADRQILFSTDTVGVRRTGGVQGQFEPEAALRQLLQGTGLTYRVTADQTILAEIASTETKPAGDAGRRADVLQAPSSSTNTSRTAQAIRPRNANRTGDSDAEDLLEEVFVTGTLIRGVTPTATNVIGLSRKEVLSTGAVSSGQLLANIPQLGGFNNLDTLQENTQITVKRPNLRNLPGLGTSGGSTTLVLMDGHRMVGAGIQQTAPDPDVVPPSVIERVEVIPDGGSATYGADAVGGVINFITRRRVDGLQVGGRYGIADDYETYDLNATAGHDWGAGAAYASFNYATHDALFGRDRDYVRRYDASGGPAADLGCDPGTVAIRSGLARTLYAIPDLAPNTANTCDLSDDAAFYPEERFRSVFAGFSQDFGDALQLDVRAFHSQRDMHNVRGPFRSDGALITAANPFYRRTPDNVVPEPAALQSVTFSWAPVFGNASVKQNTELETWGVTPTVTFELGRHWQIRALANVGRSTTTAQNPVFNDTLLDQALAGTTEQTAINPYDLAATPNQQLLADIVNYAFYGQGKQELINYRAIADGELFSLAGGAVRFAFGLEYLRENYRARAGDVVPGTQGSLSWREADRDNTSVFAELSVPIVGENNVVPGVRSLSFSASSRYDDYSDFGDTTNPKYALLYEPLEWIAIRSNWGKSFNAPSLADAAGALNQATLFTALTLPSPLPGQFVPAQAFWPLIALQGGAADIQPQTAETFSAGFDIHPPALAGLTLSASYYRIRFNDLVGFPPVFNTLDFYTNYTRFYILGPTRQQVQDAVQDIPGGPDAIAGLFDPGDPPIYALVDARRRNLGNAKLSGIDFAVRYVRDTGFGSIDAGFSGTYELERDSQPLPGLPWTDQLESDVSRFRSVGTVGATVGQLRAQAQWNHSAGFTTSASPLQTHIGSFDVVNLFFSYDAKDSGDSGDSGLLDGLQFTLSASNIFDTDPPLFRGTYNLGSDGYANGGTLGRLLQFGVNKKF